MELLRLVEWKIQHNATEEAFYDAQLTRDPTAKPIPYKVAKAEVAVLAQFKPIGYDCCINSCCLFVGEHADVLDQYPWITAYRR